MRLKSAMSSGSVDSEPSHREPLVDHRTDATPRWSSRVCPVRDRTMPDSQDADGLVPIYDLIDHAVGPDPQRPEAGESAAEGVAGLRIAFEQTECSLNRVRERPIEFDNLPTGASGQNNVRHLALSPTSLEFCS
jgi:hypothetical protein